MSAHQFDYAMGPFAKLVICFDYSKGSPGCHTRPNGDPGWPPEPEEVEITDVQVWALNSLSGAWVHTGVSLPEEVTDGDWIEEKAWEYIERQREEADVLRAEREPDWSAA